MAYPKLFWKILFVFSPVDFIKLPPIVRTFEKNYGIKEQIDTITNSYNKWLYLFHISSC